jgi:transposase-like protein
MGRKQSKSAAEVAWRERLARFDDSNLTVKQFCRQEGVSNPSFYQWRKRLKKGHSGTKAVGESSAFSKVVKSFVPVSVAGSMLAEVEFPNGVRVRVPATNAEALRTAITVGHEVWQEVR